MVRSAKYVRRREIKFMELRNLHKWDLAPKEAMRVQYRLRKMVRLKPLSVKKIRYIAGVDVSVKNGISKAAIVVLSFPELKKIEAVTCASKTVFPYVPGLLSFREGPVILKCMDRLRTEPDVFIFDGQGLAHPRKFGIASHIGIILGKPTIGSAKSRLYGEYEMPGRKKGDRSTLKDKDNTPIGAVLRTRNNAKPVFVSPGHLTDIDSSVKIILASSPKYRIPEPIRAAHLVAAL